MVQHKSWTPSGFHSALQLLAPLPCAPGQPCWAKPLEAQGTAKIVGVRFPNPVEDTHLSTS